MSTELNKLPIIESPKYRIKIPSTGKSIEIRPFTVREEKMMMIAQESNDQSQILSVIRDVVKACTFGKISINLLTMYDFEYIFIQLRSKSVGETATVGIPCSECKEVNEVIINFDTYDVVQPTEVIENKYQVNDSIGIVLKPITFKDIIGIDVENTESAMDSYIVSTIESIYDPNNVYKAENYSGEELLEFINSLPHAALEYIQKYVENQPKINAEIKFTCSKCKKENITESEGILNFF